MTDYTKQCRQSLTEHIGFLNTSDAQIGWEASHPDLNIRVLGDFSGTGHTVHSAPKHVSDRMACHFLIDLIPDSYISETCEQLKEIISFDRIFYKTDDAPAHGRILESNVFRSDDAPGFYIDEDALGY